MQQVEPDIEPTPELDVTDEQVQAAQAPDSKDDQMYTVLKHENLFVISKKTGIPASELAEHNDLPSWDLHEGQRLHLPYPVEKTVQKTIRYEELPYPKTFHVSKEGGARKYLFGNHKSLDTITPTGAAFPQNKTFTNIVAAAVIDIEGVEYAYWMDTVTYDVENHKPYPGRLYGFALGDLSEGTAPDPEPELALSEVVAPIVVPAPVLPEPPVSKAAETVAATLAAIEPKLDELKEWNAPHVHPTGPNPSHNKWKTTYNAFMPSALYMTIGGVDCKDYDNKRPNHWLDGQKTIRIAGTFLKETEVNGVMKLTEFGRPQAAVQMGTWHGIPMDNLQDIYDTSIPKEDDKKINPHKYTWDKFIVTPVIRGAAFVTTRPVIEKIKQKRRKVQ